MKRVGLHDSLHLGGQPGPLLEQPGELLGQDRHDGGCGLGASDHDGLLGQGFEDLLRQSVRQSGCVLAQPGAHVPGPGGLELARGRVPA